MENKKSWFRRHWVLTTILVLFILGMIGAMFSNTSSDSNTQTTNNQPPAKEYTDKDIYDLWFDFLSNDSPYTDLQKEEQFKQYKNKWIKSSGVVSEIAEVPLSSSIAVVIESPDNPYLRSATLYFDGSYKDALVNYGIGEEINFEGKIENYNSIMGLIIKDAQLK